MSTEFCEILQDGFRRFYNAVEEHGIGKENVGLFRRILVDLPAQLFNKPSDDFRRYGRALQDAVSRVFWADAAGRNHYSRFSGIMRRMARLGFMDDRKPVWRAGYVVMDTIPADVLVKTPVEEWTPENLVAKSTDWMRQQLVASKYASKQLVRYDTRYLDPARLQDELVAKSIEALSPLQKKAIQQLAGELQRLRTISVHARHETLLFNEKLREITAKLKGKEYVPTPEEEILEQLQADVGPTISSYIPHFVYDVLNTEAMKPYIWKLAQEADFEDLREAVVDLIDRMPSEEKLREMGLENYEWLAAELGNMPEFSGIDPDKLQIMASNLVSIGRKVKMVPAHGMPKYIPRDVFVQFFMRRYNAEVGSGLLNPFRRLDAYVVPTIRKAYMEPVVAAARIASAGLGEIVDPAAAARLDNWLNSLIGVRAPRGIEYVISRVPGLSTAINRVNSITTTMIYTKMLWMNLSTAVLNLTQPLQFGLGKNGWLHAAAAFRIILDRANYGRIVDALEKASLMESSLGALTGGRGMMSTIDMYSLATGNPLKEAMLTMKGLVSDLRMAASPEEARHILLGDTTDAVFAAGSLMSLVEQVNRNFVAVAAAHRSVVDQLLEHGGVLVRQGTSDVKVRMPDGTVIDTFEEMLKAAPDPKITFGPFHVPKGGSEWVDWERVLLDATMHNADINFVLSSANYSPFEWMIRDIPVIGPAAATFTNYTMHVANRLAHDVLTIARGVARNKFNVATRVPATPQAMRDSAHRLARFAFGTLLIGGPYAFKPLIENALRIANAIDPDIPRDIYDPTIKGVLDGIEKFTLTGISGIDYSYRVGIQNPLPLIFGGRFVDNPLAEMVATAWRATPWSNVSPEDRYKARYEVLGSFARFFDPEQEYGDNPVGRLNPLFPIFMYNIAQMVVDLHARAHGEMTKDALGRALESPLPVSTIIGRGLLGRTTFEREKFSALAEHRPALAAKIRTLRRQFVDAYMSKDFAAMREVNAEMHRINPLGGEVDDSLIHPDLTFDMADIQRWRMRHFATHEQRQLLTAPKGVLRYEASASMDYLRRNGYITPTGGIDVDKIESSNDPLALRHLSILEVVHHRAQ